MMVFWHYVISTPAETLELGIVNVFMSICYQPSNLLRIGLNQCDKIFKFDSNQWIFLWISTGFHVKILIVEYLGYTNKMSWAIIIGRLYLYTFCFYFELVSKISQTAILILRAAVRFHLNGCPNGDTEDNAGLILKLCWLNNNYIFVIVGLLMINYTLPSFIHWR